MGAGFVFSPRKLAGLVLVVNPVVRQAPGTAVGPFVQQNVYERAFVEGSIKSDYELPRVPDRLALYMVWNPAEFYGDGQGSRAVLS